MKIINNKIEMVGALFELNKTIQENNEYISKLENDLEEKDKELDMLVIKMLDLEKENMYLRIVLNKLLEDKEYTIEGLLEDMQ